MSQCHTHSLRRVRSQLRPRGLSRLVSLHVTLTRTHGHRVGSGSLPCQCPSSLGHWRKTPTSASVVNATPPAHFYPYPYPYSYRSVMSVPPRSRTEHRVHYLESFISHMAATPEEKLQTILEFVISFTTLVLVYEGSVNGAIGVTVAGFVMSVDLVRALKAFRETRRQMQQQPDESNS